MLTYACTYQIHDNISMTKCGYRSTSVKNLPFITARKTHRSWHIYNGKKLMSHTQGLWI